MLSTQLHEAVQQGFIDLEDKSFMDLHKGRNLASEERALAVALLRGGKAFIRDPKNIADEDMIGGMIYRGLRNVSPQHAALFGEYYQSSHTGRFITPDVRKHIVIKKVKGKTGDGWKLTADLDKASEAAAWDALSRILSKMKLPVKQGGTETRTNSPREFMLMQPLPVKASGWQGTGYYWQFKHAETRNYLFVNAEKGTVYIPTTPQPFMRGEFG